MLTNRITQRSRAQSEYQRSRLLPYQQHFKCSERSLRRGIRCPIECDRLSAKRQFRWKPKGSICRFGLRNDFSSAADTDQTDQLAQLVRPGLTDGQQ